MSLRRNPLGFPRRQFAEADPQDPTFVTPKARCCPDAVRRENEQGREWLIDHGFDPDAAEWE